MSKPTGLVWPAAVAIGTLGAGQLGAVAAIALGAPIWVAPGFGVAAVSLGAALFVRAQRRHAVPATEDAAERQPRRRLRLAALFELAGREQPAGRV